MIEPMFCWCGSNDFLEFSSEYVRCNICKTLVSLKPLSRDQLVVQDDEADFYGKQYWIAHQSKDLGFPTIYNRARNDLTERNLHWLKTLMKYCLPPSDVLELGCSHGSFVAVMRDAGYRASGVEMSPWVVAFGKETFSVPIYLGPVENLSFAENSFDTIALMDVLEHLPDPLKTLQKCVGMLKADGLLLIQTPEFKQDITYPELVKSQSPFLEQLKADEHIYLFSQSSVLRLLRQIGFEYINFEPAIFSDYDMFLVAGRQPLKMHSIDEWEKVLLESPSGRMVLALLDTRERELALREQLIACDIDRIDKLEQISKLSDWLKQTQASLKETQASLERIKSKLSNPFIRTILQAIRIVNQISKKILNKV